MVVVPPFIRVIRTGAIYGSYAALHAIRSYSPECVEGKILGSSLTVVGRSTDEAPQAARRDAPPLKRLLGLHSLVDRGLPLALRSSSVGPESRAFSLWSN